MNHQTIKALPAWKRKKTAKELVELLVPRSKRFQGLVESIDQARIMVNCIKFATVLKHKEKASFHRRAFLFSVYRLTAGHIENKRIRKIAREILSYSFEHVARVQQLKRMIKQSDLILDFVAACAKIKHLIRRWLSLAPSDSKIFTGFCPERIMFGIVATLPFSATQFV